MTHPSETGTPSPDLSAIRARAENCRTYNFGMRDADILAHHDVPALLARVQDLETALDVRFEHSDHQSAKYYTRMRAADHARSVYESAAAERVRLAQEQAWNRAIGDLADYLVDYDQACEDVPNPYAQGDKQA